MTRTKDFGSSAKKINKSPITFTLEGEEFEAKKMLQGKVLLDFAQLSDDPNKAAAAIPMFFEKVLLSESLERFSALIDSDDRIVEVETLAEIVGWLMEQYTNLPEEQSKA